MSLEVLARRPHPGLWRWVDRYVGYRVDGPPGVHRGLPGRRLTFIVDLDSPRAFVAGLRTSAVVLPHSGRHYGIAIELGMGGARALFDTPAGALTESVAELEELIGARARGLAEALAEANDWDARFEMLDRLLLAACCRREPPPEIAHAWQLLTGAVVRVDAVAREVGWSRRHLSETFRREIGLAPRQLARVLRFERSCRLLRSERVSMTEVAHAAGYFDHAHMLHEWRSIAGIRPRQWLDEELLSVQAEADAAA